MKMVKVVKTKEKDNSQSRKRGSHQYITENDNMNI